MNDNPGYNFYCNASNYTFSAAETSYLPTDIDASKLFNHLISPCTLSCLLDEIGISAIYHSCVDENHLLDVWKDSIPDTILTGRTYNFVDLSSIAKYTPYPGMQVYQSGVSIKTGEGLWNELKDYGSFTPRSDNSTMMTASKLHDFLKASYCKDFGNMTNIENIKNVKQDLNDESIKSAFTLPVHKYSAFLFIINELRSLFTATSASDSNIVISSSTIQSLLKLIYNFLNNVYIYYPRIIKRSKHVKGYLSTAGTYVWNYYTGGKKETHFATYSYVGIATPLVMQVDNSRSSLSQYLNISKTDPEVNRHNISTNAIEKLPEFIELRSTIESDENTFDLQSAEGSNGSFQVTKKYTYSKVHPLDDFDIADLYSLFEIQSGKEISFGKIYYAIKFLFDLWQTNVSYFQVSTFVCHSNCHLNAFTGAEAPETPTVTFKITYDFTGNTSSDALDALGVDNSTLVRQIFAQKSGLNYTVVSNTFNQTITTAKDETIQPYIIIPTAAMARAANINGFIVPSTLAVSSVEMMAPVQAGLTYSGTSQSSQTISGLNKLMINISVAADAVLPLTQNIKVKFNTTFNVCQLTINPNGGKLNYESGGKATTTERSKYITKGTTLGSLSIPNPTKSGSAVFQGWRVGSSLVDDSYAFNANTTITAMFGVALTVYVGSTKIGTHYVDYTDQFSAIKPSLDAIFQSSRFYTSGYTLDHWSLSTTGSAISNTKTFTSADDVYAVTNVPVSLYNGDAWIKTIMVDYNSTHSSNKTTFNNAFAAAYPNLTLNSSKSWKNSDGTEISNSSTAKYTESTRLYANVVES